MTEIQLEHLAPCGLYCGVCRIRQATQENDLAYLQRLAKVYARRLPRLTSVPAEELWCEGCLSSRRFPTCQQCSIRECTQQNGCQGCHECPDFPCFRIDQFPMPAGRKVILRAVPYRRANGTEQWVRAEEQRYQCPECGQKLFRGARECRHCSCEVDVD